MKIFTMTAALLALWASAAMAAPQGFALHEQPQDVANVRFETEDGTRSDLESLRGKVLLVNIWATWCLPCREEMPTLDDLQAQLGSDKFEVMALSIDRAGQKAVKRFYEEINVQNLELYVDKTMLSATALRAVGLPTTLLINAEGKELGRLVGPAEWNTPEMVAFLKSYVQ